MQSKACLLLQLDDVVMQESCFSPALDNGFAQVAQRLSVPLVRSRPRSVLGNCACSWASRVPEEQLCLQPELCGEVSVLTLLRSLARRPSTDLCLQSQSLSQHAVVLSGLLQQPDLAAACGSLSLRQVQVLHDLGISLPL